MAGIGAASLVGSCPIWKAHYFPVFPQPSELGGLYSIVLLIRVASPADMDPDVRNVLITQKGDPAAGIRPVSYGAKVLTGSTAREMLIHLGLHIKCKPFTMRNCEIRLALKLCRMNCPMNSTMVYGAALLLENCRIMFPRIWKGLNKLSNSTYRWRTISLCELKPIT